MSIDNSPVLEPEVHFSIISIIIRANMRFKHHQLTSSNCHRNQRPKKTAMAQVTGDSVEVDETPETTTYSSLE
jgi:hypothetical protein